VIFAKWIFHWPKFRFNLITLGRSPEIAVPTMIRAFSFQRINFYIHMLPPVKNDKFVFEHLAGFPSRQGPTVFHLVLS
jgi:hypothetical protein